MLYLLGCYTLKGKARQAVRESDDTKWICDT